MSKHTKPIKAPRKQRRIGHPPPGNGATQLRPAPGTSAQYQLTENEQNAFAVIAAKFELASERAKSAEECRQTAGIMRQRWVADALRNRGLPPNAKLQLDPASGTITVTPDQQPPGGNGKTDSPPAPEIPPTPEPEPAAQSPA